MTLDRDNYLQYYKLYIEEDDPTEYSFVKKHIGTLEEWDSLCLTPWFKPIISQWRKEVELKIKSKALRALRLVACGDTRDAFVANRYLLDGNWKETKKRGRPSKQEIEEEKNKIILEDQRLKEDWNIVNVQSTPRV